MTPVSIKHPKLIHNKSQDEPKKCSETKLDDSLKKRCELELDNTTKHEDLNLVFANHGDEDELYPLTTVEIAEIKDLVQAKCKSAGKRYLFSTY
jgi:hypothetical protein